MSEHDLYLGIDPGKTGAAAAIDKRGQLVEIMPAGWTKRGLCQTTVEQLRRLAPRIRCAAIEEVIMFSKGLSSPKSSRAVALSAGAWLGTLGALGVYDVRDVRPQTWQSSLSMRFPKGGSKEAACRLAGAMYGATAAEAIRVWGDGVADALLVAEWLRKDDYTASFGGGR